MVNKTSFNNQSRKVNLIIKIQKLLKITANIKLLSMEILTLKVQIQSKDKLLLMPSQ